MTFLQIVAVNMLAQVVPLLFLVWMSRLLLGRIPGRGWAPVVRTVLSGLLLISVLSVLGALCYLTGAWDWLHRTGILLWIYFSLGCEILFLRYIWRASLRDCCLCVLMIHILFSFGMLIANLYNYGVVYDLSDVSQRRTYLFWLLGIRPFILLLCGLVILRSGAGRVYQQWLEQESLHKGILILLTLYPLLEYFLEVNFYEPAPAGPYMLFPFFLLLTIHLIFVYVGRDYQQKQDIMAKQSLLRQQTIYIEKLEQIQTELRRFRHDFKNMMAGMYLQAKEGDLDAVQNFIQEMTGDFDRQVGGQIRLMQQLGNVRVMEVRSLLLDKLTRMQQEEIACELEAPYPFETTRMRRTDLCRCLGILIDNAMDEVRGHEDGQIHLMISRQDGCTTFRVRNTLYKTADLNRLGTDGYTTKGYGRGVGLESYRRILEKYDFVFSCTAVQDRCFIQEIKIQE